MSRVERTENPNDSRRSEQPRQAERGRIDTAPTPTKAEGELADIEQALEHQKE